MKSKDLHVCNKVHVCGLDPKIKDKCRHHYPHEYTEKCVEDICHLLEERYPDDPNKYSVICVPILTQDEDNQI
jgi:hypothetical protein